MEAVLQAGCGRVHIGSAERGSLRGAATARGQLQAEWNGMGGDEGLAVQHDTKLVPFRFRLLEYGVFGVGQSCATQAERKAE